MTRSKELRRREAALEHRIDAELRWALAECELRRRHVKKRSALWYRIEREVRKTLVERENGYSRPIRVE
jgi:hypothetical protein